MNCSRLWKVYPCQPQCSSRHPSSQRPPEIWNEIEEEYSIIWIWYIFFFVSHFQVWSTQFLPLTLAPAPPSQGPHSARSHWLSSEISENADVPSWERIINQIDREKCPPTSLNQLTQKTLYSHYWWTTDILPLSWFFTFALSCWELGPPRYFLPF